MNWFRKLFGREAKYLYQEKAKTPPATPMAPTAITTQTTKSALATDRRSNEPQSVAAITPGQRAEQLVQAKIADLGRDSVSLPSFGFIDELVAIGVDAIPPMVTAINRVLREGGGSGSQLGAAGALCAAIGRIGGPNAFDLLVHYVLSESAESSDTQIRYSAIRGLAQLGDERGIEVLIKVLTDFAGFEREVRAALQQLGVTDPAILSATSPWHAGVNLRDPIAIAHAFRLQKDSPDFTEFERVCAKLDKNHQYTAWHELAAKLETLGKYHEAGQCWVQALCCDSDPVCFNWPNLASRVVPQELRAELKRCYATWDPPEDQASAAERVAMARRLQQLLGRPGEQ